jgi:hypothetical protein
VFGWKDGQLYLQAYDVLEDDARDWKRAQQKLLSKSLAARIQKELKKRDETMNWDRVASLAHQPRGIPVSVSTLDASVEQVLASAIKVQNRVPEGATWDGKSDLPMDEQTFQEVLSDRDPAEPETAGGSGKAKKSGT